MFLKKVFRKDDYALNYAVDYPKNFDEGKKYPVIFYLHGMGMVQKGVDFVIRACPVRRERIPDDLDFITLLVGVLQITVVDGILAETHDHDGTQAGVEV